MNRQAQTVLLRALSGVAIVVIFSAHTVLAQTETAPKAQPELAAADQGTGALKTDDLIPIPQMKHRFGDAMVGF